MHCAPVVRGRHSLARQHGSGQTGEPWVSRYASGRDTISYFDSYANAAVKSNACVLPNRHLSAHAPSVIFDAQPAKAAASTRAHAHGPMFLC